MKRLTITLPDDFDPGLLTPILAVATDILLETSDEAPKPGQRIYRPGNGKTALSTIMDHFTPDGVFTRETAQQWLATAGYAKAATPVYALVKRGRLRNLGAGKFQFTGAPQ